MGAEKVSALTEHQHTPGPWRWHWAQDHLGHADGRVHTDPKNNVLTGTAVCVAVSPRYQSKEQWEADARLIAAAPDMLAALKAAADRCQLFLDTFGDVGDCVTQADINDWHDVVARAEGGSSP